MPISPPTEYSHSAQNVFIVFIRFLLMVIVAAIWEGQLRLLFPQPDVPKPAVRNNLFTGYWFSLRFFVQESKLEKICNRYYCLICKSSLSVLYCHDYPDKYTNKTKYLEGNLQGNEYIAQTFSSNS